MKVAVDLALCESHGHCLFAAPAVFDFDEDEELVHDPSPDLGQRTAVERAARGCPARAITVDDGTLQGPVDPAFGRT